MPLVVSILLISVAAVWLALDQVVRRRFRRLKSGVPAAYLAAAPAVAGVADPEQSGEATTALMPLAVDLMRGRHGHAPFDTLSPDEQQMVFFAHAINSAPRWMVRYAMLWLPGSQRRLARTLYRIHQSRPAPKIHHYTPLRARRRLPSPPEM